MAHGFFTTDADERSPRDPDLFTPEELRAARVREDTAATLAECERYEHSQRRRLIVSRHPAAVEFIRSRAPEFASAPVVAVATIADVCGAVVAGNLPLHLAMAAAEVVAVEFSGPAPRGAEYGLPEMLAAGARLAGYRVTACVLSRR